MSDKLRSLPSLEWSKRSIIRAITSAKLEVENALAQNPSEETAHKVSAHLGAWNASIKELRDICEEILEATDMPEDKTKAEKIEEQLTSELISTQKEYANATGKLNFIWAKFKTEKEPFGDSAVVKYLTIRCSLR